MSSPASPGRYLAPYLYDCFLLSPNKHIFAFPRLLRNSVDNILLMWFYWLPFSRTIIILWYQVWIPAEVFSWAQPKLPGPNASVPGPARSTLPSATPFSASSLRPQKTRLHWKSCNLCSRYLLTPKTTPKARAAQRLSKKMSALSVKGARKNFLSEVRLNFAKAASSWKNMKDTTGDQYTNKSIYANVE